MAVVDNKTHPSLAPVAGLASAIAMGVFIGYSMSKPAAFTSMTSSQRSQQSSQQSHAQQHYSSSALIRNRIYKTYAYLAGSVAITGVSAYSFFHFTRYSSHAVVRIRRHPKWYLFTSLLSSLALLFGVQCTDYQKRPILKHLLWIAMHVNEGAFLSVLGFIGGRVLVQAAILTAAILSGISLVSASAADEKILRLGAFLGVAFGFLMGMSAVQMVYPGINASNAFRSVNIYGGLLIFGLQMAYDTKKVLMKARDLNRRYDPINEQMALYLNSINFFLDLIRLILKQQEEKEKEKEEEERKRRQQRGQH